MGINFNHINCLLFDDSSWKNLLPLTFTRPVSEIRIGILTIKEKWEKHLNNTCSYLTQDYLSEKYPSEIETVNMLINGSVLPTVDILQYIADLDENQALVKDDVLIAVITNEELTKSKAFLDYDKFEKITPDCDITKINYPWEIFAFNGNALEYDFKILTEGRESQPISDTNKVISPENIFIEEGAKVECSIINASSGPVYIDKHAEVMEGSIIRGAFYLGEHSATKLGTKIYGATTIGPHCKVGGEVNNSVLIGYSNKGHDGFLGNSVLGEWCNLGADTNNSNLKNNYAEVKLWNYNKESFIKSGLQFCGLIMGDHSKSGINTMFNTGTVVGVSSNIFGAGFPRNFIPSFSWGGAGKLISYQFQKAMETAELVMERRDKKLDDIEKNILKKVFDDTAKYRTE